MRTLLAGCCVAAVCLASSSVASAQDTQQRPSGPSTVRLPPPGAPSSPGGSALTFGAEYDQDSALVTTSRPTETTRGVTVIRRRRPDFDPVGSRIAGFRLDAGASLQAGVDTNVYRVDDGPSDIFALAQVDAALRSDWSRHAVEVAGVVRHRQFASETLRDLTTYGIEAQGQFDVSPRAQLNAEISHRRDARDQFSAEDVALVLRPVRFAESRARIQGRYETGRVVLSANGGYSHVDFQARATLDGVEQSLRDRDYDSYSLGGQVGYRFPRGAVAFVSASREWRRHPFDAVPGRDADVLEVLTGVESEITPLLFGRIAVGYLQTDFRDPAVAPRDTFAIDTRLDYLVTELTTVRLTARRTLRDAALLVAPATLVTNVRLAADHELLRNLIVTPHVQYEKADLVDRDQSADLVGGGLDTRWLINRRLRGTMSLNYRSRTTGNFPSGRDFQAFVGMVGVSVVL